MSDNKKVIVNQKKNGQITDVKVKLHSHILEHYYTVVIIVYRRKSGLYFVAGISKLEVFRRQNLVMGVRLTL